jgi:hypothetical protein
VPWPPSRRQGRNHKKLGMCQLDSTRYGRDLPRPAQPSGLAWLHPKISLLREFESLYCEQPKPHPPLFSVPSLPHRQLLCQSKDTVAQNESTRIGHSFRITRTLSNTLPHRSHLRVTSALRRISTTDSRPSNEYNTHQHHLNRFVYALQTRLAHVILTISVYQLLSV